MLKRVKARVRKSLSAKFIVSFLLMLILPFSFLSQCFAWNIRSLLMEREREHISEKLMIAGSRMGEIFHDMDSIMASLVLNQNFIELLKHHGTAPDYQWFLMRKGMQTLLNSLAANGNYKYRITVLSADNECVQTGGRYNSQMKITDELPTDAIAADSRMMLVNRPLQFDTDKRVVTMLRPVYSNDHLLGVILVEIPQTDIDEFMNPYEQDDILMYIMNGDVMLYSSRFAPSMHTAKRIREAVVEKNDAITLEGQPYLFLQNHDSRDDVDFIALVPKSSVFRESSKILSFYMGGSMLMIGVTALGILKMISMAAAGIKRLNSEVAHFGTQMGGEILLPVTSVDEIGQLTEGVMSMSRRINQLLGRIKASERNKRLLEFRALQAQINPHMIYNTLNTITYLAQLQNVGNIEEVSSSFAGLLRTISKTEGEYLTIREEMNYIKAYFDIKKYNLLSEVHLEFQMDEAIMDEKILKLLLQPLVENALIHAYSEYTADGLLTIRGRREGACIQIDVMDNGKGIDSKRLEQLEGQAYEDDVFESGPAPSFISVGVNNVRERIRLNYGREGVFRIESRPGFGTTIHLEYPVASRAEREANENDYDGG